MKVKILLFFVVVVAMTGCNLMVASSSNQSGQSFKENADWNENLAISQFYSYDERLNTPKAIRESELPCMMESLKNFHHLWQQSGILQKAIFEDEILLIRISTMELYSNFLVSHLEDGSYTKSVNTSREGCTTEIGNPTIKSLPIDRKSAAKELYHIRMEFDSMNVEVPESFPTDKQIAAWSK